MRSISELFGFLNPPEKSSHREQTTSEKIIQMLAKNAEGHETFNAARIALIVKDEMALNLNLFTLPFIVDSRRTIGYEIEVDFDPDTKTHTEMLFTQQYSPLRPSEAYEISQSFQVESRKLTMEEGWIKYGLKTYQKVLDMVAVNQK